MPWSEPRDPRVAPGAVGTVGDCGCRGGSRRAVHGPAALPLRCGRGLPRVVARVRGIVVRPHLRFSRARRAADPHGTCRDARVSRRRVQRRSGRATAPGRDRDRGSQRMAGWARRVDRHTGRHGAWRRRRCGMGRGRSVLAAAIRRARGDQYHHAQFRRRGSRRVPGAWTTAGARAHLPSDRGDTVRHASRERIAGVPAPLGNSRRVGAGRRALGGAPPYRGRIPLSRAALSRACNRKRRRRSRCVRW